MENNELTVTQKAGWFFVGFIGSVFGVLVASLTGIGQPWRRTATKMALLGMAAFFGLNLVHICMNGELYDYLLLLCMFVFGLFGIC